MLTRDQSARYSRHLTLPGIGVGGQARLGLARVLCVGAGGLGSPAALYLTAAGVGTLTLADYDAVELSNLQRQVLYGSRDVGRPKLAAAFDRLHDLNPDVHVDIHDVPLTAANALELVRGHDLVIDGTDNFAARYLVNDACVLAGRPNVWGAIQQFEGQASVFAAPGGPCYRCLHPEPPAADLIPSCSEAGVLGVLPGVIGTIQATEALKLLLGIGQPLVGRLLIYDALRLRFREVSLKRDAACPICGDAPTIREVASYQTACDLTSDESGDDIDPAELAARLRQGARLVVVDVREPAEAAICRIPGARLMPLAELEGRLAELDPEAEIVVHCKSGGRSARAAALLRARGYRPVRNLRGGILAWINQVDPTLTTY